MANLPVIANVQTGNWAEYNSAWPELGMPQLPRANQPRHAQQPRVQPGNANQGEGVPGPSRPTPSQALQPTSVPGHAQINHSMPEIGSGQAPNPVPLPQNVLRETSMPGPSRMIPEQAAPGHTLQAASMPDSRRMPPVELMEVSENMSQRQAQQGMPISTLTSADTRQDTLPATGTVEIV